MQFRRTKRAVSIISAMLLLASSAGAHTPVCLCTSCNFDSNCCSAKSCCETTTPASCVCCTATTAPLVADVANALLPADSDSCACVASSPTDLVPVSRFVSLERDDLLAVACPSPEFAPADEFIACHVDLSNLDAISHPPFRILYCSWVE